LRRFVTGLAYDAERAVMRMLVKLALTMLIVVSAMVVLIAGTFRLVESIAEVCTRWIPSQVVADGAAGLLMMVMALLPMLILLLVWRSRRKN